MSEPGLHPIQFHYEDPGYTLENADRILAWLGRSVREEQKTLGRINYYFVSDATLLEMNQRHLNHDTLTDILTFPYSYEPVAAEIYISIERVKENASTHETRLSVELRRVMIHGVLHMCGWNDKTEESRAAMRKREEFYLDRFKG